MREVMVLVGPGFIGQAIARRVGAGKQVLLADLRDENARAAADILADAGFDVSTTTTDVSSREDVERLVEMAGSMGPVVGLIHAAGVSPSQALPEDILRVDLHGTALLLERFGEVIERGGSGVVIASQSGHRLPALTAERTRLSRLRPSRSCSSCRCCSSTRSPTHFTPTSLRSGQTCCA